MKTPTSSPDPATRAALVEEIEQWVKLHRENTFGAAPLLTRAAEALRAATIPVPDEGEVGSPERDLRVIASRLNADLEAGALQSSTYWCVTRLVEIADSTAALRQDQEAIEQLPNKDIAGRQFEARAESRNGETWLVVGRYRGLEREGYRDYVGVVHAAWLPALLDAAIQQAGQRPEGEE